jgi:soluble lytic murein transglycosylase-like protein
VSDPVYNTQMGAAEVSTLLKDYRGLFILAFAGYNAGRSRVEQWENLKVYRARFGEVTGAIEPNMHRESA